MAKCKGYKGLFASLGLVMVSAFGVYCGIKLVLDTAAENAATNISRVEQVIDAFQKDQLLVGEARPVVEQAHRDGFSIATHLLMFAAENKQDLKLRDAIFLEGVRNARNNAELVSLLYETQMYNEQSKARALSEVAELPNDILSKVHASRAHSQISGLQQHELQICKDKLDSRYTTGFVNVRLIIDLASSARSCTFTTF
jgi:hypothetical protein